MRLSYPPTSIITLLLFSLPLQLPASADSSSPSSSSDFRSQGDAFSASGDYLSASRSYTSAIALDPTSFGLHYKRAISYLSLGRHTQALQDFDNILELRPDYYQAYYQKAKIYAKEGQFDLGLKATNLYSKNTKTPDPEVAELTASLKAATNAESKAQKARKKKDWEGCVNEAGEALSVGPNSVKLREMRVECAEAMGDLDGVIGDLTRLTHLLPSDPDLPVKLAHILYLLTYSPESALSHLKQCLHYDPDSKTCKSAHKTLRSLEKDVIKARNFMEGDKWRDCLKTLLGTGIIGGGKEGKDDGDGLLFKVKSLIKTSTTTNPPLLPPTFQPLTHSTLLLSLLHQACKSSVQIASIPGMRKYCNEVLELPGGGDDLDALMGRGEVLMNEEKWDMAVGVLNDAFEKSGRSSKEILNKLQKAQRLLKVSKQKDYYKVLGVARDADEKTIKRAYRTAAKTNHPDVGGSEEKMATLNEAYEVLSDPELKARYDNGDDPNDPASGGGGGPGGFPGGGQPFFHQQGGGGHQFHFQQHSFRFQQ